MDASSSIYVKSLLTDNIRLKPWHIGGRFKQAMHRQLVRKLEGVCSHHGYIRPTSIHLFKWKPGVLRMASLNGDVTYQVQFYADVCNPVNGMVLNAKIVNQNKFGLLAESIETNVLEIVVPRNLVSTSDEMNSVMNDLKVDDIVKIEVIGKKYELGDCKISVVGKIVEADDVDAAAAGVTVSNDDSDEEGDVVGDDNSDDEIPDLEVDDTEDIEGDEDEDIDNDVDNPVGPVRGGGGLIAGISSDDDDDIIGGGDNDFGSDLGDIDGLDAASSVDDAASDT